MHPQNESDYFDQTSALDQEEQDDGFAIIEVNMGHARLLFSLNPEKLADPVSLENLFNLLEYNANYGKEKNEIMFLYNQGFTMAHSQAISIAYGMYLRYKQDKMEGVPELYYSMDNIFQKILSIKVDQAAEDALKNY